MSDPVTIASAVGVALTAVGTIMDLAWESGGCAIGSAYLGNSLFFSGHILWLGVYTAARNAAVGAYLTQEYGV